MKLCFNTSAYGWHDLDYALRQIAGFDYWGVEMQADRPHAFPADFDAARRAHRARFAKIFERNAVFAAVAERVLNLVGQVAERNSGAFHAVAREQAQGIGENRLIEHQRHRFRKRTGERAQTFALAARHDHRKHRKNLP